MTVFLAVRTSIANWVLIPFLSKWLEDTTLIMVSQVEIYQETYIIYHLKNIYEYTLIMVSQAKIYQDMYIIYYT